MENVDARLRPRWNYCTAHRESRARTGIRQAPDFVIPDELAPAVVIGGAKTTATMEQFDKVARIYWLVLNNAAATMSAGRPARITRWSRVSTGRGFRCGAS